MGTKLHMLCNRIGMPIKFTVTEGQSSDFTQAIPLLNGQNPDYVIADRGYDSDKIVQYIHQLGAKAVIPPRSNRTNMRKYDKKIYRERNLIERFFGKLKQFRRVATRFEKLKQGFESLIYLASSYLWLNLNVDTA